MHVVADSQKQPLKRRHVSENVIKVLYDAVIVVKYITFLVLLSTSTISANRTFSVGLWQPGGYGLSPVLQYKLQNCTYTTTRTMYAFTNVSVTLRSTNNAEIFTDFAGQLRTVLIIAALQLVLGALNRELFRRNRFFVRVRHMYFHKDVLTMFEVLLLAWLFYAVFHLTEQQPLLKDYLTACNVRRTSYLPHVSISSTMYTFIGCNAGSLLVAFCVLVINAVGENVAGDPTIHTGSGDGVVAVPQDVSMEPLDAAGGPQLPPDEPIEFTQSVGGQSSLGGTMFSTRYGMGAPGGTPRQRLIRRAGSTQQQQQLRGFNSQYTKRGSPGPSLAGSQRSGMKAPTATATAGSFPTTAPPPPPDSFYLYQQPNRM